MKFLKYIVVVVKKCIHFYNQKSFYKQIFSLLFLYLNKSINCQNWVLNLTKKRSRPNCLNNFWFFFSICLYAKKHFYFLLTCFILKLLSYYTSHVFQRSADTLSFCFYIKKIAFILTKKNFFRCFSLTSVT